MLPDAMEMLERMSTARERAGGMLLGLDFDGTLAPIVPRPEDAAMPPHTRAAVEALAARPDTHVALVSGRSLADLRERVALDGAFYAGNHGFEIEGPGVHRIHPDAQAARGAMARLAGELGERLAGMVGAIVEDKGLTLSVHYRMVDDEAEGRRIDALVHEACAHLRGLRPTRGKKVVEVRPDVDWHKGRALAFLRDTLLHDVPGAPTIFIGDDRTDEDAFREVGDGGCAIVVGDPPPPDTAAHAALASTEAVAAFLGRLA
jgi:trehalose 6-phosphate phosphatase